jgi:hypothetical protein
MGEAERTAITPKGGLASVVAWGAGAAAASRGRAKEAIKVFMVMVDRLERVRIEM